MSAPRLAMIIQHLALAGRELAMLNLCEALGRRGWEVDVISFRPVDPRVMDRVLLEHTRVHALDNRNRATRLPAIYSRLRQWQPLIVHTHMFSAGAWGRPAARLAGVPVVVQTHGGPLFSEKRWKRVPAERLLSLMTDRVVSVSRALADHLIGVGGLDARRISVIPNGIADTSLFDIPLRERSRRPLLLAIGRLLATKGWDVLFDALVMCRDLEWTLTLVGDGAQSEMLRDLVVRLELADRVNFVGLQTRLLPLFQAADLYVSSSRAEGMSNALLEAVAAGLPVVTTGVCGSNEVLTGAGWVVPPNDPGVLARAIREALSEPNLARSRAEEARARVRRDYHLDGVAKAHEDLYAACLAARGISL